RVLAARAEVLHVDERHAPARPGEERFRVGAGEPRPAEVELEEDGQLEQRVEEGPPVGAGPQLRVVVVDAELEAGGLRRAPGAGAVRADGVEHQADARAGPRAEAVPDALGKPHGNALRTRWPGCSSTSAVPSPIAPRSRSPRRPTVAGRTAASGFGIADSRRR